MARENLIKLFWEEVKDREDVVSMGISYSDFEVALSQPFIDMKGSMGKLQKFRLKHLGVFEPALNRLKYYYATTKETYDSGKSSMTEADYERFIESINGKYNGEIEDYNKEHNLVYTR